MNPSPYASDDGSGLGQQQTQSGPIGGEALRKAIERNRRKMASRIMQPTTDESDVGSTSTGTSTNTSIRTNGRGTGTEIDDNIGNLRESPEHTSAHGGAEALEASESDHQQLENPGNYVNQESQEPEEGMSSASFLGTKGRDSKLGEASATSNFANYSKKNSEKKGFFSFPKRTRSVNEEISKRNERGQRSERHDLQEGLEKAASWVKGDNWVNARGGAASEDLRTLRGRIPAVEMDVRPVPLLGRLGRILGWGMCGLLAVRLMFANGGVLDYLSMEKVLEEKRRALMEVQRENEGLYDEILKIQSDPSYQKQLAREHLGVMAKDEFLILFAKEKNQRTF